MSIRNHLQYYPTPNNITYLYNIGYMISIHIITQITSGIILTLYYNPTNGYITIIYLLKELYHGTIIRYSHSTYPSTIWLLIYIHILRTIIYNLPRYNTYIIGITMIVMITITSFLGYILSYGQLSYWGATVITNILSGLPGIIEWMIGNYYITPISIHRIYIGHCITPIILLGITLIHIYYLHIIGTSTYITRQYLPFNQYIILKDNIGLYTIQIIGIIQVYNNTIILSHNDNNIPIDILSTPRHIVPEWYFLYLYSILKIIPNKTTGIYTIALTIVTIPILTIEILPSYILITVIGSKLPTIEYITYGRVILAIHTLITILT